MANRIIAFDAGNDENQLKPVAYHRVVGAFEIMKGGRDGSCWVLDYDQGPLEDPGADPLVVGMVLDQNGSQVKMAWRDRLWRPATGQEYAALIKLADAMRPPVTAAQLESGVKPGI